MSNQMLHLKFNTFDNGFLLTIVFTRLREQRVFLLSNLADKIVRKLTKVSVTTTVRTMLAKLASPCKS